MMRNIDADADDKSTVNESKPFLNPRDVIALASTIPNCSQVTPPTGRHLSLKPSRTLQSQPSTDSTSYFSQISCHLTETFSIDKDDDDDDDATRGRRGDEAEVLSFLVSDAYSIEQLTAEAEGRTVRPNPLDGAGIARIDVYYQTGTVCTCRLIQTTSAPNAPLLHLDTPRAGNVTATTIGNKYQNSTQFRRVIRQKCNLDALRTILTQPPKLPEINLSTVHSTSPEGNDDNSQCSTVSKKLRKRRKDRLADKFAFLSPEQRRFLKEQKKMYEKRLRQDEKIRRNMANAILSGGINESDPEITLPSLESLSLNDAVSPALTMETTETNETTNTIHQHCQTRQQLIQDKIEMADVGLAILMAEAQRLKKIMKDMEKIENDRKDDDDDSYTNLDTDTDRSRSTYQSNTDQEDGDGTITSNEYDAMHKLQGCEVEYSFPHKFHDVLEGALIGETNEEESSFSEDDSLHLRNVSETKEQTKECRGRSPPRLGHHKGKNGSNIPPERNEKLSPIVAIPTNGQGCIVLRQDGSFDVIGKIPDVLRKKLFRCNGPLPDQIAIGTKGRYYVHFDDGSFYLYGPRPLTQILKKVNGHHQRRACKQKGRKKSNPPVSVVSVSFGKKLDDLFIVLSNGAWEAHGEIPRGLEDLMKDRNDRADLLWASIGVNGEWCVKASNGNVWWGNVTGEADEALTEIPGQDLMFIDFGIDGSYFLLYK